MNEEKTIEQLLKEKESLSNQIASLINGFLIDNPTVKDIEIVKSTYEWEAKCGMLKEISIFIKLIM